MAKIKIGIVGCGNIGKRHAAVIQSEERAVLQGVCDCNAEEAKNLAELYEMPYWKEYNAFLNEIDADIISICTPHDLHAKMAIQALDKGFHVIVEKPMCLSTADGISMIEAANRNKKKLYVVKQNRFNVPVQLTTEALTQGKLGQIFMVKCDVLWNRFEGYYKDSDWRGKLKREGGALFTQGSHFIDLLIWWFGDVVNAKTLIDTQHHQIETDDCGMSILQFKSGVMGSVNWTTNVYNKNYEGSITIIGENGTIKIGGQYLNKIEYWDVKSFPLQEGIEFVDKPNSYGKYQGTSSNHDKVFKNIIANLKKENDQIVEGPEGIKSIQVIEMIYAGVKS